MLAKVIAHAPTRREAAERLALALERLHVGGVTTNRDFLVATLRTPEFIAGDTTTDFIERVGPPRARALDAAELERVTRVAALWLQGQHRADAVVLTEAPSGWRNARLPDQRVCFGYGDRELEVRYRTLRDGSFRIDGETIARVHAWSPGEIDAEIGGRRLRARVTRAGERLVVHAGRGDVELTAKPRFELPGAVLATGSLVAPMPGKVIDVRVAVGDRVTAGQTLVLLEAMKMEHPLIAPEDGVVVEVRAAVGEQVSNGALLLVVEPEGGGEKKGD